MKRIKPIFIILLIIVLGVGGYFVYRYYQSTHNTQQSAYQTVKLAKGSLTAVVGGTGTVRANQSAVLSWQTTGTVDTVSVILGAGVMKGDALASLDKTSLPQAVVLAQADLVTAQRNLADLKAPKDLTIAQAEAALQDAQNALDDLTNSQSLSVAQAESAVASAQKEFTNAQNARSYLDYQIGSQDLIDRTYALMVLKQKQIDDLQKNYDRYASRSPDDPTRAQYFAALSTAKAELVTIKRNLDYMQGKGSAQDFSDADARLSLAKANLEEAQRKLDEARQGVKPADIALAKAKVKDAQENLAKVTNPQSDDIAAAQARVDAIQATLRTQTITAPFNGVITDVRLKPGDQANPGTAAFRLDDLSALLVDVPVSEVDIIRIKIGQPVTMTFDAIPAKTYNGKVSQVGRVGTPVQGNVNFTVTVELTNPDEDVRTGMTAAVNILVNQLQDVLLAPNRAVHTLNGQYIIYVLRDNQVVAVTVRLGASSDTNSQILSSEVHEGDQIIMNPPADLQNMSRSSFQSGN
jgi:HlyD family secretion protein